MAKEVCSIVAYAKECVKCWNLVTVVHLKNWLAENGFGIVLQLEVI